MNNFLSLHTCPMIIIIVQLNFITQVTPSSVSFQDSIPVSPNEISIDSVDTLIEEASTQPQSTLPTELEPDTITTVDAIPPETVSTPISSETIEKAYFDFLTTLSAEEPKQRGKLLARFGRSTKNFSSYKLDEYNSYLNMYFPAAHSDHIQSYIIQTLIDQKKWDEVEIALLKFLYLYPNSSLKPAVIGKGSQIIQNEDYYKPHRDKLLALLGSITGQGEVQDRYFEFLSTLRLSKNTRSSPIFNREARRFIELYSNIPQSSNVLMWLAEFETTNEAYDTSFMIYQKLMTLFPSSTHYAMAKYQTGLLQQEQFNEFEEAINSFRQFLTQFPEDTLVPDAHYRIATMTDQNLKDWTNAIVEYETLVSRYPDAIHAIPSLFRIGEIQTGKLKQGEKAIATLNKIASDYPDSTDHAIRALQQAGKLYEKNKAFDKAIEQYLVVHEKYPGTDGALSSLETCATLYEKKLKMTDKTIEMLNLIVEEFPNSKNAQKATKRLKKLEK